MTTGYLVLFTAAAVASALPPVVLILNPPDA